MGCTNSQDVYRPEQEEGGFRRRSLLEVTAAQFPVPQSASEKLRVGILCDNTRKIAEALEEDPGILNVKFTTTPDAGRFPIEVAAAEGKPAALGDLLYRGAKLDAVAGGAKELAHKAVRGYNSREEALTSDEIVQYILTRHRRDPDRATCVEMLIENKKCPPTAKVAGVSLLEEAVRKGLPCTCRMLIEAKASVNAKVRGGQTLLHALARSMHKGEDLAASEVMQVLLQAGVDSFATDQKGKTYLDVVYLDAPEVREEEAEVREKKEADAKAGQESKSKASAGEATAKAGQEKTKLYFPGSP